jgi:hypothetical protein
MGEAVLWVGHKAAKPPNNTRYGGEARCHCSANLDMRKSNQGSLESQRACGHDGTNNSKWQNKIDLDLVWSPTTDTIVCSTLISVGLVVSVILGDGGGGGSLRAYRQRQICLIVLRIRRLRLSPRHSTMHPARVLELAIAHDVRLGRLVLLPFGVPVRKIAASVLSPPCARPLPRLAAYVYARVCLLLMPYSSSLLASSLRVSSFAPPLTR